MRAASRITLLLLTLGTPSLCACASTSARPSFEEVARTVDARIGVKIYWNQGTEEDEAVAKAIRDMLKRELTVDAAVQIALLNNRTLQATYEELSIAQADLVQAGLLKNPVFGATVLFPLTPGEGMTNVDLDVVGDFLDVFAIPARKKIATTQLDAAKLKVGDAVIRLGQDVRTAFYTAQGAEQVLAMRRTILESAEAAAELAKNQHDAGNISDLDLANEQVLYEQLKLDYARGELDVLTAREALTRLLGLYGKETTWKIGGKLPELPAEDPPLEHLESLAIEQRLDLTAAHRESEAIAQTIALVKNFRWLPLGIGGHYERNTIGPRIAGVTGSIELPIFDQKQAVIARLGAQLKQSQAREAALAVDIRSEVRLGRGRLVLARKVVERYSKVLVPLRERVVALSQQQYDAMLLGVYQLLLAKQNEVTAYREFIESLRDYWIAYTSLERAVGGRLKKKTKT